jgi:hypothetical protein
MAVESITDIAAMLGGTLEEQAYDKEQVDRLQSR